ncbi:hypothetical protein MRS44_014615 [Fusarium solani]|uniref:uncharacterized protein n=1 Tax=Fusarium solani TaxID=169388 RepID=UPI0032C4562A|nr:hypothetical protein MRS44_014615 [Fusarium solani]
MHCHNEKERRPRPWRIIKTKGTCKRLPSSQSDYSELTLSPGQLLWQPRFPSEVRSVDNSSDADDVESSSGDESDYAVSGVSHPTRAGDTTSSDDSCTAHQEATPERDVDVDMDERKISMTAQIV